MLRPTEPNPAPEPVFERLEGQRVDLGALRVHRALPNRHRRSIGPFVFLDAFGPSDRLFDVGSHPHTGIATVTWLTSGRVLHKDGLGSEVTFGPKQLSLMIAGRGLCHTETGVEGPLTGVQLWLALPYDLRDRIPGYDAFEDAPWFDEEGARFTLAMGSYRGFQATPPTFQPTLLLQIDVHGGVDVPLEYTQEFGLYVLQGSVRVDGQALEAGTFVYLGMRGYGFRLEGEGTVLVLGGTPVDAPFLLWWNFLADGQPTIEMLCQAWNDGTGDFGGEVEGAVRIPAPLVPGRSA